MTAWANFYDYILPEVNSATPGVVDRLLREIAIDFCERSCILTEEADLIDVVANTATYTLVPLSEAGGSPPGLVEPYKVKAAWFDNTPLNIATVDALNSFSSYWGADTAVEATAYSQKVPSEIILYPKPTQSLTNGLRVELIVRPTMGSTGLADWVAGAPHGAAEPSLDEPGVLVLLHRALQRRAFQGGDRSEQQPDALGAKRTPAAGRVREIRTCQLFAQLTSPRLPSRRPLRVLAA
jgi:hypothetical protein